MPLHETVKVGPAIYDKQMRKIRDVPAFPRLPTDPDHVVALCYETVRAGHGVLIFCPYKNQCENLAQLIAKEFAALATDPLVLQIPGKHAEILMQLRECPAGLDKALGLSVASGVAFHHAGLTMEEREIIEAAFQRGHINVLVATSTLSSGVNLPARRVIIRSPTVFNGKPVIMDTLTYNQMAGRAGRKGVDTEGTGSRHLYLKNLRREINRDLGSFRTLFL